MARPHPALIELAAGRPIPGFDDPARLLTSAMEHRMTGLLSARAEAGEVDLPDETQRKLAFHNLQIRAHHQRLWRGLAEINTVMGRCGAEVATAKGVTAEARWYDRAGDRPSSDVDLLLRPDDWHLIDEIVASVQPDHRLIGHLASLAERGDLQSVDVRLPGGISIDLHFDILKFEVRTRQLGLMWDRTVSFDLPEGDQVRVLDPETSLIHFLLHLNKDRFSWLLGFVDVVHLIEREELDWDYIDRFLRTEGLDTHVYLSLGNVYETLSLSAPSHPEPAGWRAVMWRRMWEPSVQLRGDVGWLSHHRRQYWIPLTARGRAAEALWRWLRTIFPTRVLLDYYHPTTHGPYLWRLTVGRFRSAAMRRREVRNSDLQAAEVAEPNAPID